MMDVISKSLNNDFNNIVLLHKLLSMEYHKLKLSCSFINDIDVTLVKADITKKDGVTLIFSEGFDHISPLICITSLTDFENFDIVSK